MTVWHELWRWLVVAFPEIINTEEKLRKNKLIKIHLTKFEEGTF